MTKLSQFVCALERNDKKMKERKEVLAYGMTLADVYIDTPFHDDNWVLLRYKKNKRAFAWTPPFCRAIIRTRSIGIRLS